MTFKQYNVVAADLTAKVCLNVASYSTDTHALHQIPSSMSFDQAAGIPLCFNAAALGFYAPRGTKGGAALTLPWAEDGKTTYKNQPILIFGGASNVGQYGKFHHGQSDLQLPERVFSAIQLARLSGFSPIITTASLKNTEYLKSLGATHVIDRNLPLSALPAAVGDITKEPLHFIYAAVAPADIQQAAYDLLAVNGTLVIVQYLAIEESKRVPDKHVTDIFASPFLPDRRQVGADLYKHLTALLESGEIKVPCSCSSLCTMLMSNVLSQPGPVEVLPGGLAGIPAGVERLDRGEVHLLKLIGHPQETV